MRDLAVVIVTVDRAPKRNYLEQTLCNLVRSGLRTSTRLHSLHVVDSGVGTFWPDSAIVDLDYCDARWSTKMDHRVIRVHRCPSSRRTGKQNLVAALRAGASVGAGWVVSLEDDIDVCHNFIDGVGAWLDVHGSDDRPMFPLCGNNAQIAAQARRGQWSWEYPVAAFWGFQAFAVRPVIALDFAAWLEAHPLFEHSDGRRDPEAHDLELHRWADERGYPTLRGACPSFVQHIGVDSFINPDRSWDVQFPSWPGREWSYQQQTEGAAKPC